MPPIVFHFRLLLFFYWFLKNVELYHRPCHFGPRAKDVFWGIVLLRVCSLLLFHVVQFFKCWWIYLELNSKWLYLQSQTKIVGTLVQNPFFSFLCSSCPSQSGLSQSVTKPCAPTLRGQGDTKVSRQLWLRL